MVKINKKADGLPLRKIVVLTIIMIVLVILFNASTSLSPTVDMGRLSMAKKALELQCTPDRSNPQCKTVLANLNLCNDKDEDKKCTAKEESKLAAYLSIKDCQREECNENEQELWDEFMNKNFDDAKIDDPNTDHSNSQNSPSGSLSNNDYVRKVQISDFEGAVFEINLDLTNNLWGDVTTIKLNGDKWTIEGGRAIKEFDSIKNSKDKIEGLKILQKMLENKKTDKYGIDEIKYKLNNAEYRYYGLTSKDRLLDITQEKYYFKRITNGKGISEFSQENSYKISIGSDCILKLNSDNEEKKTIYYGLECLYLDYEELMVKNVNNQRLTNDEKLNLIKQNTNLDAIKILTIIEVESKGEPFDSAGHPTVRFECHKFNQYSPSKKVSCTIKSGDTFSRVKSETDKLAFDNAKKIDFISTIKSSSFGLGQLMGLNYKKVGYNSLEDFYAAMFDEKEQIKAMIKFIESENDIVQALNSENTNWEIIAKVYNGNNVAEYSSKLINEYSSLS